MPRRDRLGGGLTLGGNSRPGCDPAEVSAVPADFGTASASHRCRSDLLHLPHRDAAFDAVVCFRFMQSAPREIRIAVLAELARVAGRVVVNYPNRTSVRAMRRALFGGRPLTNRISEARVREEVERAGLRVLGFFYKARPFFEDFLVIAERARPRRAASRGPLPPFKPRARRDDAVEICAAAARGGPMPRPNLLRIDDVLLRVGRWLAVAWLFASLLALAIAADAEARLAPLVWISLLALSAPIGLLVAGMKLRARERRAWALHRLVDDHVEISASDLLRDSDFTAVTLERAIRDLNNAGAAFLVWDRSADVVQDGRLRSRRVQLDECDSCGAKVSLSLRVGQVSGARCPYCHDPVATKQLIEEKARLIDELDTDPVRREHRGESSFSVVIFVLLLLAFWPLGIGYAFWHWRAQAGPG